MWSMRGGAEVNGLHVVGQKCVVYTWWGRSEWCTLGGAEVSGLHLGQK